MATRRGVLRGLVGATVGSMVIGTHDAVAQQSSLQRLVDDLSDNGVASIVHPGSPNYRGIRYWNARYDCFNATTYISPKSSEAVSRIVAWAIANGKTFAVRGGGHSFAGKSAHSELVVDMSSMVQHRIGRDGAVTAEAGVLLGPVHRDLAARERVVAAGSCPTVGLVGHVLGGGVSAFLPIFGYAAQSLRALTLVTFTGTTIKIDDTSIEHISGPPLPQLPAPREVMTVLRGAGQGSLGIVTDMTITSHDVSDRRLVTFKFEGRDSLSAVQAAQLILARQDWRRQLPDTLKKAIYSKIDLDRSGPAFSLVITGLIATTSDNFDAARNTLTLLEQRRLWKRVMFSGHLSADRLVKSLLDDEETTHNRKRKHIYGSSSVYPSELPRGVVDYFLANLPERVELSISTAGGATKEGPDLSIQSGEYTAEWVGLTVGPDNTIYRDIRRANLEVMRRAGFEPFGLPSYCDPAERAYFPNKQLVADLRQRLDPNGISTSSLLTFDELPICR